jgi:outer membrane protein assembly factor BamB
MPGSEGGPGQPEALIIATGQYEDREFSALRSPSRDAEELAAVLEDPAIGGFGVHVLLDKPWHVVREEIQGFFADRRAEDLLVLYLSGHGVKDDDGLLHFVASTTKLSRLAATGIPADFVYQQIDRCRARKVLLLLDCCFSGAYRQGRRPKAAGRAEIRPLDESPRDGRGRAVITSCTALEYALELDTGQVGGTGVPSVFTAAVVEGLRTGDADRDGDGLISVDDLYSYVFDKVREITPDQKPEKKWGDIQGDFIIARSPRPPIPQSPPAASRPGHEKSRGSAVTRRALLGLAAASGTGLAITGWDLLHHEKTPPPRRTTHRSNRGTQIWSTAFPGDIAPSVEAVAQGIVYVNSSDSGNGLCAMRASDGVKVWASNSLSFQQLANGVVYASGVDGLYALSATNGTRIWRFPSSGPTGPAIAGGTIYVADNYGEVYAISRSDGRRLWSFSTSQGEPSAVAATGDVVYVGGSNTGSSVYAIRSGRQIWRSPIQAYSGPAIAGASVFIVSTASNPRIYALRHRDGAKLWDFPTGAWWIPLIANGTVYVSGNNGVLPALRATDGKEIWRFNSGSAYPLMAVSGGDTIYVSSDTDVYALRAKSGAQVWHLPTSLTHPITPPAVTVTGDTVYVCSNNLLALQASDGKGIWSFPVEGPHASPVTVAAGVVYFAGADSQVYALRA